MRSTTTLTTTPKARSLAAAIGALALLTTACNSSRDAAIEEIIESQSGQDVDIDFDDGGFSVQTEDGEFSIDLDDDGNFTFDAGDEGSATFESDGEGGGDFSFEGDGESGEISVDTDEDGNLVITDDNGGSITGDAGSGAGGLDLDDLLGGLDLDDLDLDDLDTGDLDLGGIDINDLLGDLDLGDIDLGDIDTSGLDLGDIDLGDLLGDMSFGDDGSFTVSGPDGETSVTGDDGSVTVTGEDGAAMFESGSDIPDQWPSDIPEPSGVSDITGSYISGGGDATVSVIGTLDGDDVEGYLGAYGAALESAGFTETSSYNSAGTGGGFSAERGDTLINVNVSVIGEQSQVIVGLQLSDG